MPAAIKSAVYQLTRTRTRGSLIASQVTGRPPSYPDPVTLARELGYPDKPEVVASIRRAIEDVAADRPPRY